MEPDWNLLELHEFSEPETFLASGTFLITFGNFLELLLDTSGSFGAPQDLSRASLDKSACLARALALASGNLCLAKQSMSASKGAQIFLNPLAFKPACVRGP